MVRLLQKNENNKKVAVFHPLFELSTVTKYDI